MPSLGVVSKVGILLQDEKTQWWPVYREPEHELVGRIQLHTSYSTSPDDNNSLKV